MSKVPDRSTHFHFSHADGLCRHTKPKMSLKCIPTEAERPHKNLLIPILNFNHWDSEEFSAQPAEPHGNHPGPNDSVIVTSLPPVCFMPAWPHSSLQKKKLHNVIYTSLNARDPAACAAIQPFLQCRAALGSCGGECHRHHDGTQLVVVSASLSQLAQTALPSQRWNPSISKSGCHH